MQARPELTPQVVSELVAAALREDVGDGDRTTTATVPGDLAGRATVRQKAPGVVFGLAFAQEAFAQLGASCVPVCEEGVWREGGEVLAISGPAAAILTAERTALNFLGRLSGIATLTARFVRTVQGTGCRILDTRKTTPGLRVAEKAAVVAGGGVSHRFGLFDEILIKENHIAAAGGVGEAVAAAAASFPDLPLEIECRDEGEVREALAAGAKRLMLDNMSPRRMAEIVREVGGRAKLEASGNVTLENVREIAEAGLDFVSIGALTHSAPVLDLSLLMEPAR
jgi:nicotinate-nucleotide pyrophosphorylase (carboxylating)